jgi:hypothetical protein
MIVMSAPDHAVRFAKTASIITAKNKDCKKSEANAFRTADATCKTDRRTRRTRNEGKHRQHEEIIHGRDGPDPVERIRSFSS